MPVFQLNGILKTLCTSKSAKYKANSDNINITNNNIINCKVFAPYRCGGQLRQNLSFINTHNFRSIV